MADVHSSRSDPSDETASQANVDPRPCSESAWWPSWGARKTQSATVGHTWISHAASRFIKPLPKALSEVRCGAVPATGRAAAWLGRCHLGRLRIPRFAAPGEDALSLDELNSKISAASSSSCA